MSEKDLLLNELPEKLKVELTNVVYHNDLKDIVFFENKSPYFLAAVAPLLRRLHFERSECVYMKDDPLDCSEPPPPHLLSLLCEGRRDCLLRAKTRR